MTSHRGLAYFLRVAAVCAAVAALPAVVMPSASAAPRAARIIPPSEQFSWKLVDTGVQTHYRGLAVVSRTVAWLGGYNGVVLRTVDGGKSWSNASPAGASGLQFRDIAAFSATRAVAMAAGTGTDSRLYVTGDGGSTWSLAYQNTSPQAFFDCMAFFNPRHGLLLSDPVDGKFRILSTSDGGHTWPCCRTPGCLRRCPVRPASPPAANA